jgi:hypothetical protein
MQRARALFIYGAQGLGSPRRKRDESGQQLQAPNRPDAGLDLLMRMGGGESITQKISRWLVEFMDFRQCNCLG